MSDMQHIASRQETVGGAGELGTEPAGGGDLEFDPATVEAPRGKKPTGILVIILVVGLAIGMLFSMKTLTKVSGGYVPGALQDVMYVAWYVPIGAAARAQLHQPAQPERQSGGEPAPLVHALPYVAVLLAFLMLVYVARADVGGPVAVMTIVAFVLTLLVMVRQGTMLRDDARTREPGCASTGLARRVCREARTRRAA